MMTKQLWAPAPAAIELSQLTAFSRFAAERTGLPLQDYADLHAWSISDPGAFWQLFWDFTGIIASRPATDPVIDLDRFPGARWFPGARLNFAENLLTHRSDRTALISHLEQGERRTMSYAVLYRQTERIAARLSQLDIQTGDRIAAWLPNIPETIVAMLATSSTGAVFSSCSPDFGTAGALDRFGQIEPKVLFACDGYYYGGKVIDITDKVRQVAAQVPSIKEVVWVRVLGHSLSLEPGESEWSDWLDTTAAPLQFAQLPFDHPLYILYSSGTTGKPKCIVHGQGGTLLQHKKEHQLHLDLRASDTLFFFTTCGWMMWNWVASALASGCAVVLYDGSPLHPTPAAMFDLVDAEDVTVFGISAKFLTSAQKQGVIPRKSHRLDRLRVLISTGSPLTNEGFTYVYRDIKADCHLVSMSGGTDIISCFMIGNPNLPVFEGELQCAGLGMAVDIWDDNGNSMPSGSGELVCTRPFPSAPVGFWNDPGDQKYRAAYFARFDGIWVHGDYAERTEHGGFIIHGRSDAVLNPGGVRIGTAEIYSQVEHFEQIVDAVCVGQQWQDDVRVVLFLVMRDGVDLTDELIGQLRQRIRDHASPRHMPAKVVAVADIPRTMSGKIAELAVRDVIHGRAVKNTSALANPEALALFKDLPELQS